jgi:hypothetical protein
MGWTIAGYHEMMNGFFRGNTLPTAFKMALVNDTVLLTDDWAQISANDLPSANGYTAGGETITNDATGFPVLGNDGTDEEMETKEITWTASGNWATAATAVVLNTVTGTVHTVAFENITAVQPQLNDVIRFTMKLKLKTTCA